MPEGAAAGAAPAKEGRGMAMQPNLRMLQEMQSRMIKLQEQLGEEIVTGSAGGGAVTCQVTGLQQLKSISIKPEAVDPNDLAMLEDLIVLAVNDGMAKAKELYAQRLSVLTGGIRIPGLM
jgi:DNA-binding YbaB/EbfC family protein